jgi:mono/diheme cytochrome c family protein
MADQKRKDPYESSGFYADGASARPPVAGTVMWTRDEYVPRPTGGPAGNEATSFPFALTKDDLIRGRERYEIYCSVCHGRTGEGDGMIVQRGFTRPPAFFPMPGHQSAFPDLYKREQVIVNTPPGHIFNVITNGYGAMYNYAARVSPDDRWRIAGYVKALQLSRTLKPDELPDPDRAKVQNLQASASSSGSTTQPTQSGTSNAPTKLENAPK